MAKALKKIRRPVVDFVVSCSLMMNTLQKDRSFEQIKLDRGIIEYNCKYIKKFWLKLFQLQENFGGSVNRLVLESEGNSKQNQISYCELSSSTHLDESNIWATLSPRFVAKQASLLFRISSDIQLINEYFEGAECKYIVLECYDNFSRNSYGTPLYKLIQAVLGVDWDLLL